MSKQIPQPPPELTDEIRHQYLIAPAIHSFFFGDGDLKRANPYSFSRDGRTLNRILRQLDECGYIKVEKKSHHRFSDTVTVTFKAYEELVAEKPDLFSLWQWGAQSAPKNEHGGYFHDGNGVYQHGAKAYLRGLLAVHWYTLTDAQKKYVMQAITGENREGYRLFVYKPAMCRGINDLSPKSELDTDNLPASVKKANVELDKQGWEGSDFLVSTPEMEKKAAEIWRSYVRYIYTGLNLSCYLHSQNLLTEEEANLIHTGGAAEFGKHKVHLGTEPEKWDQRVDESVVRLEEELSQIQAALAVARKLSMWKLRAYTEKIADWVEVELEKGKKVADGKRRIK